MQKTKWSTQPNTTCTAHAVPMFPLINSASLSNASHAAAAEGQESTGPQLAEVGRDLKELRYTCSNTQVYESCLLCSPDVCITSTLSPLATSFTVFVHRYHWQKLSNPCMSQLCSHGSHSLHSRRCEQLASQGVCVC